MTERSITSLTRGLVVIEALNRRAYTTLNDLHEETDLPKSTLVRLLDTLIAAGYVRRISRNLGYCLTDRVTLLSQGFQSTDRLIEASRPHLRALTQKYKWPVAIATLDDDAMQARYSTLSHSPFALDRIYIGRRIALLLSALGRAYFAFSSEETRSVLLSALQATGREMDTIAHDEAYVLQMVRSIRKLGYAISGAPLHDDRAFGLAVPVLKDGEAVAAITMRFIRTAITPAKATRFIPELQKTAAAIAAEA